MSKRVRADSRNSLPETQESNVSSQRKGGELELPTESARKYAQLDASAVDSGKQKKSTSTFHCALAPHRQPIVFGTAEDYEAHYRREHVNRCSECRRNLPTEHFLDLHISENHDPIRAARQERGERTFRCFVEDCDRVCSAPRKRRLHLIDKHGFPANYDFFIVNNGIDGRRSMLRTDKPSRRRKRRGAKSVPEEVDRRDKRQKPGNGPKTDDAGTTKDASDDDNDDDSDEKMEQASNNESETDPEDSDHSQQSPESSRAAQSNRSASDAHRQSGPVDDLAKSMSSLRFVPHSIRFGRGAKAGFSKR